MYMIIRKMIKRLPAYLIMTILLALGMVNVMADEVKAAEMKSSNEIVKDMGIGWNLGNSLDSHGEWIGNNKTSEEYEIAWGNPKTTKIMIDKIKEGGFNTVRIPVTWSQHMQEAPDYKVDEEWMARVQEVVDYCISNDMYAIINLHHDDWIIPLRSKEAEVRDKLEKLWLQIANHFINYGDKLIFETMNEPRLKGTEYEWTGGTSESRSMVNEYNKVALDAIRATGGNNEKRAVMMPTYAAGVVDVAINDMVIPNDDNIIISLHAYLPYDFAMNINGTDIWGSDQDKKNLDWEFDKYYNAFVSKGIPVVISEFGSINKGNVESRMNLAEYYVKEAAKRGMTCIWWDNNVSRENEAETFGLFNRDTLEWYDEKLKNILVEAAYSA